MESRFWRRLWREECERTRYFISLSVAEGIIITGLVGALVWVLR